MVNDRSRNVPPIRLLGLRGNLGATGAPKGMQEGPCLCTVHRGHANAGTRTELIGG
jgi:hypothetical protein